MIRAIRGPLALVIMFFASWFVWDAAREMAWWTFAFILTAGQSGGLLLGKLLRRPR